MSFNTIYITTGEPAGVGPEITLKALYQKQLAHQLQNNNSHYQNNESKQKIIVLGDVDHLYDLAKKIALKDSIHLDLDALKTDLNCEFQHVALKQKVTLGELSVHNSAYVLNLLDLAINACMQDKTKNSALLTAPVHKAIIHQAGYAFSGHTNYLAEQTQSPHVLMLLQGLHAYTKQLILLGLASVHIALQAVPEYLYKKYQNNGLTQDIQLMFEYYQQHFQKKPKILVAGLNPHIGEQGLLGQEEIDFLQPWLNEFNQLNAFNKQTNDCISGLYSGDTLFLNQADMYYCMYHDQGLAPFKSLCFNQASNITLGLPFFRNSVDHGTALTIAPQLQANSDSMSYCLNLLG